MKRRMQAAAGALLLATGMILVPAHFRAQESAARRKLLKHEAPPYPALARNMALEGAVKADVFVSADGSVESVSVLGGHPVLAQAAVNTVRRWRWEATGHESHELVQVKFSRPE